MAEPPRKSPVEAAHVDHAGKGTRDAKGTGSKAADRFCIPLCQRHHDEQGGKVGTFRQRGGWKSFELKYGFDAVKEAEELWRLWPRRHEWEAKHG